MRKFKRGDVVTSTRRTNVKYVVRKITRNGWVTLETCREGDRPFYGYKYVVRSGLLKKTSLEKRA